jgi:hypothetical protein
LGVVGFGLAAVSFALDRRRPDDTPAEVGELVGAARS